MKLVVNNMRHPHAMTLLCNNKPVGRVQFVMRLSGRAETTGSPRASSAVLPEKIHFSVNVAIMDSPTNKYEIRTAQERFALTRVEEISINDNAIVYEAEVFRYAGCH